MGEAVIEAVRALPGGAALIDVLGDRTDVWIVGGAVRDALCGATPRDVDLVVEGDAVALAEELGSVVAVHDRFGTAEAVVDGLRVGVARARSETYERPGALPTVRPASLDEDLTRRDFTVNALAVDLAGALHAPPGARDDLGARVLRVLHARSFLDDPTRLWRAARYAARLGFAIEPGTQQLARAAVASGAPATVSGSRLGSELSLALEEADPAAALVAACELGLLPAGAAPRRAVVRDALAIAPADASRGTIALAAICGGVAPERLRTWLDELALPAERRDVVVAAVAGADGLARALADADRPSAVAAAARGSSPEAVALAGALGPADAARSWLERLRAVRLEIDGSDLRAAGIEPGPELGRRLAAALDARLDGVAIDRAGELRAALA